LAVALAETAALRYAEPLLPGERDDCAQLVLLELCLRLGKGDVDKDQEGIQTMQVLGQNMAWLMRKLYG